jgi:hypothetical protein
MKKIALAVLLCAGFVPGVHADTSSSAAGYHAYVISSDYFSGTYSVNDVIYTISPKLSESGYYRYSIRLPETGTYEFKVKIEAVQRTTFLLYYNADLITDKISDSSIEYSASLSN